jgi:hypothetical protein
MATKIATFDSIYKSDFAIVEEHRDDKKIRLYPHTDQLSFILKAINEEFKGHMPPKIARVDHRASDFEKEILSVSGLLFCNDINGSRADELQFYPLLDEKKVTHLP